MTRSQAKKQPSTQSEAGASRRRKAAPRKAATLVEVEKALKSVERTLSLSSGYFYFCFNSHMHVLLAVPLSSRRRGELFLQFRGRDRRTDEGRVRGGESRGDARGGED